MFDGCNIFNGVRIYPDPHAQPDFYAIADWRNPQETATAEWYMGLYFMGAWYLHPSLIDKLFVNGVADV